MKHTFAVEIDNDENFDVDALYVNVVKDLTYRYDRVRVRALLQSDVDVHNGLRINALRDKCHEAAFSSGWWHVKVCDFYPSYPTNSATVDVRTLPRAVFALWCATKLALILTEGAEAIEGLRTGQPDKHLPQYPSEAVELADVVIRVMDYAGGKGLDIGGAVVAKLAYNATRADHRPEERAKAGGKEF